VSRTLALDIGGTKTLLALVEEGAVVEELRIPTERAGDPAAWFDAIAEAARPWRGGFARVAAAVSGVVVDGQWSALNPATLPIGSSAPLARALEARLGAPAFCVNDAQAAAWGEHRFGAGERRDCVFVTISTGIGGGVVIDGKLLIGRGGLAGSVGLTRAGRSLGAPFVDDVASGRWMAEAARGVGREADAPAVFAAAAAGERWAEEILAASADAVANLLVTLQLLFDPPLMVIGGGVGLAPGYAEALRARFATQPTRLRPDLRLAALGARAGVVGAADLAVNTPRP
jgi:N-acetylmannosamine-6-phosphate 2-epimerase/N-acetylmannosamine kinase